MVSALAATSVLARKPLSCIPPACYTHLTLVSSDFTHSRSGFFAAAVHLALSHPNIRDIMYELKLERLRFSDPLRLEPQTVLVAVSLILLTSFMTYVRPSTGRICPSPHHRRTSVCLPFCVLAMPLHQTLSPLSRKRRTESLSSVHPGTSLLYTKD